MTATMSPQVKQRVPVSPPALADFCRRWKIVEFAVFGSALRDDFGPDSDVDVLVTFEPRAGRMSLS